MKRTSLFGLFGVLAALPYIFLSVSVFLVIGLPTSNNMILRKADADFNDIHKKLLSDYYLIEVSLVCGLLWFAFIIWLAWKSDFIKKEYLKFWQVFKDYPKAHPGGVPGMIARLASVVLAVIGGEYLYSYSSDYLLSEPGSVLSFLTSFSGQYERITFHSLLFFPLVPLAFSMAALCYCIIVSKTRSEFWIKMRVPLTGFIAFGALLLSLVNLANYIDLNKDINNIPGITYEAEPRSLMVLSSPAKSFHFESNFSAIYINPLSDASIPFTRTNEEAISIYLETRNYRTCLRGSGYSFLTQYRMRELDAKGALDLHMDAFNRIGDSGPGIFTMLRIDSGPAKEQYYEALKEISDESSYTARGKSALTIGRAYAKFGELDKADYWFKKGVESAVDQTDETKEKYRPPTEPPFFKGGISGRIILDDMPAEGLRVGLMKEKAARSLIERNDEDGVIDLGYDLMRLTDGTATDSEGRFSFDGLGEDEYLILLSLIDVEGKEYKVLNSPGVVSISEDAPAADVGVISLITQ